MLAIKNSNQNLHMFQVLKNMGQILPDSNFALELNSFHQKNILENFHCYQLHKVVKRFDIAVRE